MVFQINNAKCLILILLMFLSVVHINAQDKQSLDLAKIRYLMSEQEQAWNNNDLAGFMEHYWHNDSLRFIGKKGIQYGWENTLLNYRKSYPDKKSMGQLTFTILSSELLAADKALIVGQWQLKREKDLLSGYFTLLWRKISGRWFIVLDHSS